MAFGNFQFPQVLTDLGLTLEQRNFLIGIAPASLRPEFARQIDFGASLALSINTEKARSEFIIAPVLLELKFLSGDRMGLFSGVSLIADPARGLQGVCDFILTRSSQQLVLTAPFLAVVESKNDNVLEGLPQCIAAMYALDLSNQKAGLEPSPIHGVITTGSTWKFLRLERGKVTVEIREYYLDQLEQILGVLVNLVDPSS